MAFIPTPNGARIVIGFRLLTTQEFSFVLHATKSAFTETDMINLADAVDAVHAGTGKAWLSSDCTYVRTTVYDIRTSDGAVVFNDDSTGAGGGTDVAPINVALVISLRTAARGRSGRGRMYIAGMAKEHFLDGHWTTTIQASVLTYVGALQTAISGLGWDWVVRSTQQDNVKLTTAVTRPIIAYDSRSLEPGTQRRRVDRP